MRCKFSHFKNADAPIRASSVRDVTTGVRCATPCSRCAAARTLAKVTACGTSVVMQRSSDAPSIDR
ncbi:MAG: hypothetical protein NVS4B5_11130 [Vulcanimicrobiaceae bacterium]